MAMKQKNLPAIVPEVFEHEQFGQFRFIKRGEEIWFVGLDIARALGYKNGNRDVKRHVDEEDRLEYRFGISGQNRKVILINESGMYCLIFGSNLPAAKKFTRWVTHEVLPSIRKYGFYGLLNSGQMLQLPIQPYVNYLGKLTPEQYEAHLGGLTADQYYEHYERLKKNLPNMTQEEILSLVNDPHVVVSKIIGGKWEANFF